MITITKEAARIIEASLGKIREPEWDPFLHEEGKLYLKHDRIEIKQKTPGKIVIEFSWKGRLTHTMEIEGDLVSDRILTLEGVEGRCGIKLDPIGELDARC